MVVSHISTVGYTIGNNAILAILPWLSIKYMSLHFIMYLHFCKLQPKRSNSLEPSKTNSAFIFAQNPALHHDLMSISSWTHSDANVTCKSLGFSNGTFSAYMRSGNLTSHLQLFAPKCAGSERHLLECAGARAPHQGLTVCERYNIVSLHCEGFHNELSAQHENWAGVVFQRGAPHTVVQQFSALFTNISQSVLEHVDVDYAGLAPNRQRNNTVDWFGRPHYDYMPGSGTLRLYTY